MVTNNNYLHKLLLFQSGTPAQLHAYRHRFGIKKLSKLPTPKSIDKRLLYQVSLEGQQPVIVVATSKSKARGKAKKIWKINKRMEEVAKVTHIKNRRPMNGPPRTTKRSRN